VIITHASLEQEALRLAAFRRARGLSTAVIDVEDIYDELRFGAKDPAAIRELLALARRSWRRAPRWVLFLGDASFDPRNYLGHGDADLVPTGTAATELMETASDDSLADFDGDGVPELAVGRLPARTAAEAALMVSKTIAYEQAGPAAGAALLVTDGAQFAGPGDMLAALLPADLPQRLFPRPRAGRRRAGGGAAQRAGGRSRSGVGVLVPHPSGAAGGAERGASAAALRRGRPALPHAGGSGGCRQGGRAGPGRAPELDPVRRSRAAGPLRHRSCLASVHGA
jgi:hypothetical protein